MTIAHAHPGPELDVLTAMADTPIAAYVEPLRRLHAVLCPRQVLGVRSALLAARQWPVAFPQTSKRIIALVEMDGCYSDGVLVASGCSVGHRTMRVIDTGKVAVTFFDTDTLGAIRIRPRSGVREPRSGVRERAAEYAAAATSSWQMQRDGYARMPDVELLDCERVRLSDQLLGELLTRDGRVVCERCGEDIFNGREVRVGRGTLCRPCAGAAHVVPAR